MKRYIFILSLLAVIVYVAGRFADPILEKIINRYNKFASLYHVQKVYIHTDKNVYKNGEHIWFKFYLTDDLHRLDTVSTIGYVELIGPDMNIADVRILRLNHGTGTGDFFIPDSIPSGMYMIRGYTNLMKNFGEKFFFKKLVTIKNPKINRLPQNIYLDIKYLQSKKHKLKITFHLAGRHLLANKTNRLYLFVTDYLGNPIKATVYLKEGSKVILIKQTDSAGFALLRFKPQQGKHYKLIARASRTKGYISLGKAQKYGYLLDARQSKQNIDITVTASLPQTLDKQFKTVYLLAERNGRVYFTGYSLAESDSIKFTVSRSSLPHGPVHLVLFNGKAQPVAEQTIFNQKIQSLPMQVNITRKGKTAYILRIRTDSTVSASVSVAITSTDFHDTVNIINYLSLKADIPDARTSLLSSPNVFDYVKAYSWQRYSPDQIWLNSIDSPRYEVQKSLVVKGKVTKLIMDLPVSNTLVTLTVLNAYNDQYQTYTDDKGHFYFKGLDYQDTILALVEARARNGSKNVLVYIDKYDTIPARFTPIRRFGKIRLHQIQVPQHRQWQREPGTLHSHVDQVIYMKDIETGGYTNIFDLLKGRVPGYYKLGDEIYFRGPSSITQNFEPLYLLDNVPVDKTTLESLNLEDIDRIEIIKNSAYSAIYGARGANGVIAVYTKKGYFIQRGYAKEAQPAFYSSHPFVTMPDSALLSTPFVTYLWNSMLLLQHGVSQITFHLPAGIKNIKVNLQGIDQKGRIINFNKNFMINE